MQRHDNVPMYLSHCSMCPVWQQGSTSLLGHAASPPQALLPQPLYGCLLAQNSSLAPLWEACFDSAFLHMLLERDTAGVTADNSSLVCSWEIPRQKNQGELLAALKKKTKKNPKTSLGQSPKIFTPFYSAFTQERLLSNSAGVNESFICLNRLILRSAAPRKAIGSTTKCASG